MRSISRPRDVGPARPEGSTLKSRASPKEGNRQNLLARFDKISLGARTKNGGRGGQLKCVSISRPRDVGPARPEGSTLLSDSRAPRLKKRFNYFVFRQ